MQRLRSAFGILICLAGLLIGVFGATTFFMPPIDPTGTFDRAANDYNARLQELAQEQPNTFAASPAPSFAELQRHNSIAAVVTGGLMLAAGFAVLFVRRAPR